MRYLFGDGDIAAQRLQLLAEIFAGSTRSFLAGTGIKKLRLAFDLGCGPGYSTHLLADTLHCTRTAGLDSSEHFVSLAQQTATENVFFRLHDVTRIPFPVGAGDVIFCRFLLTHAGDPKTAVMKWAGQLQPGGFLLLEEVESIATDIAAFARYLEIVRSFLAHQSNQLYVGPELNSLGDMDMLERRSSKVATLPVRNSDAATMFLLNMQTWKKDSFIRTNNSSEELSRLEEELQTLRRERGDEKGITWGLRQIVYQHGLREAANARLHRSTA